MFSTSEVNLLKILRILLVACLCAALTGCGGGERTEQPESFPPGEESSHSAPSPAPPSESEVIDPYEKAATISAPESSQAPPEAEEAGTMPEGGAEPPPSSAAGPRQESAAAEESTPSQAPISGESRSAQGALSAAEQPEPPAESASEESTAAVLREEGEAVQAARGRNRGSPGENGTTAIEQELLAMINSERTKAGVEALGVEDGMQLAAGIRAREALQSLSHTRPDGTPYYTTFDEAGFSYAGKWHGENLAMITIDSDSYDEREIAEALFSQWLESPGHQQNMLGNFLQTGIGVYIETDGDTVQVGAAQLFAGM